jgi:hypothetical protein
MGIGWDDTEGGRGAGDTDTDADANANTMRKRENRLFRSVIESNKATM